MKDDGTKVLVTGISGFIAKHIALALLDAGYGVRGTIRSPGLAGEVRAALGQDGRDPTALELVGADLDRDDGWDAAVRGVRYVLHTASPFPVGISGDRLGLVPTARGGTLRVVAASERAGVERLVLTSSVAAVYYGHEGRSDRTFGQSDWTNVDSRSVSAYAISKTLAERAAWDATSRSRMEMVSVNPALVLGPLTDRRAGSSVAIVRMMMQGRMPLVPDIALGIVDVRDVAAAHLAAMIVPEARGRRFLLSAGSRSLRAIGEEIGRALPDVRTLMPRATLPDVLVRWAARWVPAAAVAVPELGVVKIVETGPAQTVLGLRFRPPEEAIRATAEGLVRLDLVRRRRAPWG